MEWAGYDLSFMFKYSERPETFAANKLEDDVPEREKTKRLNQIIELQQKLSLAGKQKDIGQTFEVLAEGTSKKSEEQLYGRTSQNKVVVFNRGSVNPGDYVQVKITSCTSATLLGEQV